MPTLIALDHYYGDPQHHESGATSMIRTASAVLAAFLDLLHPRVARDHCR